MNQSELEGNTCSQRQARENACEQVTIGLALRLIGRESGARLFNQSQSVAMKNQRICVITFHTQLKTALLHQITFCTGELHFTDFTKLGVQ